MLQVMSSTL